MLKVAARPTAIPPAEPPPPLKPRLPPTEEQAPVVGLDLRGADPTIVVVMAGAGTGKTSTLEQRAHAQPGGNRLCLVFNKSVRSELSRRLPETTVSTSHALAYHAGGKAYKGKMFKEGESLGFMTLRKIPELSVIARSPAALECVGAMVNAYLASADMEMGSQHIPEDARVLQKAEKLPPDVMLIECASDVWRRMRTVADLSVPMTHDGYLKEMQLRRPILNFAEIWVDEAQDTNPAVLDLVLQQRHHAHIILVGDPYQSIYGWRGAVNALESVQPHRTFQLTQSFRFGPEVARIANVVLGWRGAVFRLKGLESIPSEIGHIDRSKPYTVLSRSAMAVVRGAIEAASLGRTVSFIGGRKGYPFATLVDAYSLYCGQKEAIKNPYLSTFEDWGELKDAVKAFILGVGSSFEKENPDTSEPNERQARPRRVTQPMEALAHR